MNLKIPNQNIEKPAHTFDDCAVFLPLGLKPTETLATQANSATHGHSDVCLLFSFTNYK